MRAGFTLASLAISLTISGFLIAGAWASYNAMKVQMKVAEIDRTMDQYGHSALMDMTNRFSWAWGAIKISDSPNTRWEFYVDDKVDESRNFHRYWFTVNDKITVSSRPDRGILFNGLQPAWNPITTRQYHWWDGVGANLFTTKSFDQRDRMSLTDLKIYFNQFEGAFQNLDPQVRFQRSGVVEVRFTMQYRYAAPNLNRVALRTFADSYVRERIFKTEINMRNWDATNNDFREKMAGSQSSDAGS